MIRSQRFPEFNLIVHEGGGQISVQDFKRAVEESHVGEVMPFEIWDLSRAEVPNLDIVALGTLLAEIVELVPPREGERTAFVASGDLERDLAQAFTRMAEFQGFSVAMRTFRDMEAAILWLFPNDWQGPLNAIAPQHGEPDPLYS